MGRPKKRKRGNKGKKKGQQQPQQSGAAEGSSEAESEGSAPETESEGSTPETESESERSAAESELEGPTSEAEGPTSEAEGPTPEAEAEGSTPETETETKAEGSTPETETEFEGSTPGTEDSKAKEPAPAAPTAEVGSPVEAGASSSEEAPKDEGAEKDAQDEGGFVEAALSELRSPGSAAFLLVILACLTYAVTYKVPFLFDDAPVVTRNPKMWSWDGLTQVHQPFTRTLTYWTFVVNFKLAHGDVVPSEPYEWQDYWSYHLVSNLLHAGNGALLFLILLALFRARPEEVPRGMAHWVALVGAAIWIVHPANTMAVAYIAQRFTLFGTFLFLSSMLCYVTLRHRLEEGQSALEGKNLGLLGACYFLAFCCCFAKENTTVIPAALLLIEIFFFRFRRPVLPLLLLGMFGLGLVVGLAKLGTGPFFPERSPTSTSRADYFFTEIPVLIRYLRLQLLPTDLTVEQAWPILFHWKEGFLEIGKQAPKTSGATVVGVALIGHVLIWLLAARLLARGHRFIPFAIAFYYLGNLVESSFIPILDPMVDHRMYLPTIMFGTALAVAVARGLPKIHERFPATRDKLGPALAVGLVLALSVGTVVRCLTWTDPIGVWKDTIAKRPDCARAYSSLGMEHLYKGQWKEAIGPIEAALDLGPYHVEGWNNVGKAYLELGQLLRAKVALERGIQVNRVVPSPSVIYCYNNLALVHNKLARQLGNAQDPKNQAELRQHWIRASALLRKAIQLNPLYDIAYLNLAESQYNLMTIEADPKLRSSYAAGTVNALDDGEKVLVRKGRSLSLPMRRWRLLALSEAGVHSRAVEQGARLLGLLGDQADLASYRVQVTQDVGHFALKALEAGHAAGTELAKRAIPLLEAHLQGQPKKDGVMAITLGLLHASIGGREQAQLYLKGGLETVPGDPRAAKARQVLAILQRGGSVGPGPKQQPGPQVPGPQGPGPQGPVGPPGPK